MKAAGIVLSAATVAAAVSCMNEQAEPLEQQVCKTFIGYVENEPETRTSLNTDFSIRWNDNDHITVFSKEGSGTTFDNVTVHNDGKSATFTGSIELSDSYYAIYPAQDDASYASAGEKITATLPTVQTAQDGTFADGVNLAVSKTSGEYLYFRNAGALLSVKCPTNYAGSVKIISRDPSVKMSGKAVIGYNDGNPVVTASEEAVNYVMMNGASGKVGSHFYFVAYPGVYSQGFDIVFTNSAGTHSSIVSSSKSLDLKRNDNIRLYSPDGFAGWNAPSAPYGLSWQPVSKGIKLTWSSKAAADFLDGYRIYIRPSASAAQAELKGETSSTTYTISGLTDGTYYDIGVSAKGSSNNKDSEIIWLNNILFQSSGDSPVLYPFEENRSSIPKLADMTLCYGGNPSREPELWDKERWKKHAVYTSRSGKDYWLFDSFLALEFSTVHEGKEYVYDLANTEVFSAGKEQWIQQLDYWFDSTYGFQALDDCIDEAIATAGPYPQKRYVVFSLPEPVYFQQFADKSSSTIYWGQIDGEEMDFSKIEHRKKAYIWMIDQVRDRFAEKSYRHIELAGFYIIQECLSESYNPQYKKFKEVISHASAYCSKCNEGMYWIPYGYSSSDEGHNQAIRNWKDYGFTATVLQPNKYWDSWRDWSTICQSYIVDANLGMELEFEGSHGEGGWSSSETPRTSSSILETVMTNNDAEGTPKGSANPQAARNKARFREYMQKCKEYGIYGNRMIVLYSGSNAWVELAESSAAKDQDLYHETAGFLLLSPLKNSGYVEETEVLKKPADLFVEQNDLSSAILSWTDSNTSESGFRVYKCTAGDMSSPATADKGADVTEYRFNWLSEGTSYTFGVQARGSANGSHSEVVYAPAYKMLSWEDLQSFNADYYQGTSTFTGTYRECGAPQNPTFKQTGNSTATLGWSCWSSAETGFNIYVRNSSETSWKEAHLKTTVGVDAVSAKVTDLTAGQSYTFGVQTKGKTMARNSNIITVGTYTMAVMESAAVSITSVTPDYAYVAIDYKITGLKDSNSERGIWISTTSNDPAAATDGAKLKGPSGTSVKQLIPASRLNSSIKYYMRAYVWDGDLEKYIYSEPQQIQLAAQPDPITLSWTKQTYSSLPSSVSVYKTTSNVSGRSFNAWYAVADPKQVDFRVMYPETVGTKKTVASQATAAGDCYVLINGAIFGNYNIGAIITEGAMTQQWHGEIEGCYWGTDNQLYNITRAMIGVDSDGNPGAYWVGVPWQNKFYYYTSPMTTVVGQNKYGEVSATYPYPAATWDPYYAISCGPMLVYDGKIMVNHKKAGDHYMTNYECWDESGVYYGNPDRTAVGITEDGKIVLFVCDGRISASKGAYLTELAQIMKGLGCVAAMNLDGGGSTGMWVNGAGMINHMDGDSWRAVKSTLGFFRK